ncbi:MAG: TraX family protein [Candidatus Izemoplasmatales bacterium]|jgi:hypothetical protein|nr:TraX family protein [Candidatus Izemoplasmatales bacterium]
MNRFILKLLAVFTMLLDHIAFIFLDSSTLVHDVFRFIGRISFVLFAYLIAEGFHKTKDIKKYLLRLAIFAGGIELALLGYYLIGGDNMLITFNIFWTLLFGLMSLYLFFDKNHYYKILIIPLVVFAELLDLSYGGYGVLMILFFGVYQNKVTNFLHLLFLNLIFIQSPALEFIGLTEFVKIPFIQWASIFAIIFIFLYNGEMGKYRLKWFFYLFYPGHLLFLYLLDVII